MGKFKDLTGMRFGMLLLLSRAPNHPKTNRTRWNYKCDCGNTGIVIGDGLATGRVKSCGCYGKSRLGKETRKYPNNEREVFKKEWQAWAGMKRRCTDETSNDYHDYMARGIKVCPKWETDFLDFLHHIGPSPRDGQRWSVGRIDNNLGYQHGNVEWQLDSKQARNHTLQKNNKTGVAGVALSKSGHNYGSPYYMAYWNELDGKRKSKCFSIDKYGKDKAFILACEYRAEQIKRLNEEGADYAPSHGQPK